MAKRLRPDPRHSDTVPGKRAPVAGIGVSSLSLTGPVQVTLLAGQVISEQGRRLFQPQVRAHCWSLVDPGIGLCS